MALIKCPECGKDVSEQAEICIHCGYPIKRNNSTDLIQKEIEEYLHSPWKPKMQELCNKIKPLVEEAEDIDSKLVEWLADIVKQQSGRCSWPAVKEYCEMVDCSKVCPDSWKILSDEICKIIAPYHTHSDGNSGTDGIIVFAYPIHLLIEHASEESLKELREELNKDMGTTLKGTRMEWAESYYNDQSQKKEFVGIKVTESKPSCQNTLKCPKCGSTAVSTGARGFSIITGFWGSGKTVNRCGNCGYKWEPRK